MDDFIANNNQSIFVSEQDTKLKLYFDTDSEYHNINSGGVISFGPPDGALTAAHELSKMKQNIRFK